MFRVLDAPHASEIYSLSESWDWVATTLPESDLALFKVDKLGLVVVCGQDSPLTNPTVAG